MRPSASRFAALAVLAGFALAPLSLPAAETWREAARSQIEGVWQRPVYGRDDLAVIQLRLTADGRISAAKVLRSAGNQSYAESLLRAAFRLGRVLAAGDGAPPEPELQLCFSASAAACLGDALPSLHQADRSLAEIQAVFERNQGRFDQLFASQAEAGSFAVSLTIAADGHVSAATKVAASNDDLLLEARVLHLVRSLVFEAREGPAFTYPNYTLRYTPRAALKPPTPPLPSLAALSDAGLQSLLRARLLSDSKISDAQIQAAAPPAGQLKTSHTENLYLGRLLHLMAVPAVQDRLVASLTPAQLAALRSGERDLDTTIGQLVAARTQFALIPEASIGRLLSLLVDVYQAARPEECSVLAGNDQARYYMLFQILDRLPEASASAYLDLFVAPLQSGANTLPPPISPAQLELVQLSIKRHVARLPDEDSQRVADSIGSGRRDDCWAMARILEGISAADPDVQRWWLNYTFGTKGVAP